MSDSPPETTARFGPVTMLVDPNAAGGRGGDGSTGPVQCARADDTRWHGDSRIAFPLPAQVGAHKALGKSGRELLVGVPVEGTWDCAGWSPNMGSTVTGQMGRLVGWAGSWAALVLAGCEDSRSRTSSSRRRWSHRPSITVSGGTVEYDARRDPRADLRSTGGSAPWDCTTSASEDLPVLTVRPRPARYDGSVKGDTMTMTARLPIRRSRWDVHAGSRWVGARGGAAGSRKLCRKSSLAAARDDTAYGLRLMAAACS
jgi:hypothetical protein